jgi:hypothetical protein
MPIPESQLDTWSGQGAIAGSRDTYATVKGALESSSTRYAEKGYQVFLQGSYGNDTNIYTESDVDVVIRLDDVFFYDISALSDAEKQAFHSDTGGSVTYGYFDFKSDVIAALQSSFGTAAVTAGKKAIMIEAHGNRRKADVIPAAQFRRYRSYSRDTTDDYLLGIAFFTDALERVENFPRPHSAKLTTRHKETGLWLKPLVRILKNMRRRMERDELIPKGLAPSYFLEGLLYNVPLEKFGKSYEDSFVNALNWILDASRGDFVCVNEAYYLIRDAPHVCWKPADADAFLDALVKFWENW